MHLPPWACSSRSHISSAEFIEIINGDHAAGVTECQQYTLSIELKRHRAVTMTRKANCFAFCPLIGGIGKSPERRQTTGASSATVGVGVRVASAE